MAGSSDMAGDRVRAVYGWRRASRWAFLVLVVAVSVSAVPMLVAAAVTVVSPPTAVVMVLLAAGWLVFAVLTVWRLAQTLELTDTELRWRTPVRRGAIELATVRGIRPVPVLGLGGVHAIETADGTAVWMLVSRGFDDLVRDVTPTSGALDVRLSKAVGRVDRLPGRNQYRRLPR
jgi:hypothetical protein